MNRLPSITVATLLATLLSTTSMAQTGPPQIGDLYQLSAAIGGQAADVNARIDAMQLRGKDANEVREELGKLFRDVTRFEQRLAKGVLYYQDLDFLAGLADNLEDHADDLKDELDDALKNLRFTPVAPRVAPPVPTTRFPPSPFRQTDVRRSTSSVPVFFVSGRFDDDDAEDRREELEDRREEQRERREKQLKQLREQREDQRERLEDRRDDRRVTRGRRVVVTRQPTTGPRRPTRSFGTSVGRPAFRGTGSRTTGGTTRSGQTVPSRFFRNPVPRPIYVPPPVAAAPPAAPVITAQNVAELRLSADRLHQLTILLDRQFK